MKPLHEETLRSIFYCAWNHYFLLRVILVIWSLLRRSRHLADSQTAGSHHNPPHDTWRMLPVPQYRDWDFSAERDDEDPSDNTSDYKSDTDGSVRRIELIGMMRRAPVLKSGQHCLWVWWYTTSAVVILYPNEFLSILTLFHIEEILRTVTDSKLSGSGALIHTIHQIVMYGPNGYRSAATKRLSPNWPMVMEWIQIQLKRLSGYYGCHLGEVLWYH